MPRCSLTAATGFRLTRHWAGCPLIGALEDGAAPRSAYPRGGRRSEVPRPDQSPMAVPEPDGGCRPRLTRLGSRVLVCSLVWLAWVSVHQAAAQVVSPNIRVSSALATDSEPDVAISG